MAEAPSALPSSPPAKSELDSPKVGDKKSPKSSEEEEGVKENPTSKDPKTTTDSELVQTRLEGRDEAEVMKGLDLSEKTDGLLTDPGDLISPLIKVTNGKAANNNKMTNKVNSDRLNSNSASPGSTHGIKTEEEENLTTKLEKERRKRREEREEAEVKQELEIPESDLALATVPGMNFDPKSRAFSDEELKPQPIIRKRRKVRNRE